MDQVRRYVLWLGEHAPYMGADSALDSDSAMSRRLCLPLTDDSAFRRFEAEVEGMHYTHGGTFPKLTERGWALAEELSRDSAQTDEAFVAMWFHDDLKVAYTQGFYPALDSCGFKPVRIDREPHNDKIDAAIIAKIRKCGLMVADLTGCRLNVFYEAGLAQGLGKEVLFTCHKDHRGHYLPCDLDSATPPAAKTASWLEQIDLLAFDVRQSPVLRWSDPDDLNEALSTKIRALGLDLPVTPSFR